VNAAAKTTPIVMRIIMARTQVLNGLRADNDETCGEAIEQRFV